MGNPAYDARREAERAEAERDRAAAEAGRVSFESITAFFAGKAHLSVEPGNVGHIVRFVRDPQT